VGTNGRPSISKRQKELVRAERQRDKAARRDQRKHERQNPAAPSTNGESEVPAGVEPEPASTPTG